MIVRSLRPILFGVVLTLTIASTAFGFDCFIASRSLQGNLGALHSRSWGQLTLADIFSQINQFAVQTGCDPNVCVALSPDQVSQAVAEAEAAGVPAFFDTRINQPHGAICATCADPNLANGKGLDHLDEAYGPLLFSIYFSVLGP